MKKKRVLLFAVLGLLTFVVPSASFAQSTPSYASSANDTGVRPFTSYGGARENINFTNGNLNIQLPLLELPGRNGLNLSIGIEYDSKSWKMDEHYDAINLFQELWWKYENVWPAVGTFGWRLTVPYIVHTTTISELDGTCYGSALVTLGDGSKYSFNNKAGCGGPLLFPVDAQDAIFARLDSTNLNNIVLYLKNGTQIHFPGVDGLASKIVDTNGNVINIQRDMSASPWPITITDTVGRTVRVEFNYAGPNLIKYKNSNGEDQFITFGYQSVPIATKFVQPTNRYYPSPDERHVFGSMQSYSISLLTSVVLPNNKSYKFFYDQQCVTGHPDLPNCRYGELTKIVYPTGGYTSYEYTKYTHLWLEAAGRPNNISTDADFRQVTKRKVCRQADTAPNPACLVAEDTTNYVPGVQWAANTAMSVTDPESNLTKHYFQPGDAGGVPNPQPARESKVEVYTGSSTLLRTVETTYAAPPTNCPKAWALPTTVKTTLGGTSQVSKVELTYDTFTATFFAPYEPFMPLDVACPIDNALTKMEYGYGSGTWGALARKTVNTWLKASYLSLHILDRKSSEKIFDPSDLVTPKAETQYEYDGTTPSTSGAIQHESKTNSRGNVTKIRRWRNLPAPAAYLDTVNTFDDAGNMLSTLDPLSHPTTFSYADNWNNTTCQPAGSAKAYVTQITNALGHVTSSKYNSCTGTVYSITDPNNLITTNTYDFMDRPNITTLPDGGQVDRDYDDTQLWVRSKTLRAAGAYVVSKASFDQLGRVLRQELCEDGADACAQSIKTDFTFDGAGRKKTVTNPYRSTSDTTFGTTAFCYDGLGRVRKVTPPDGTAPAADCTGGSNLVASDYSGNTVTVTDQAGKQRRSYTDALGRLIQVDEPGPSAGGGATPGTGSVAISGSEQSAYVNVPYWGCVLWFEGQCWEEGWVDDWQWVYDSGIVEITVNGVTKSTAYGQASTASSVAAALVAAINADANYSVTASAAGSLVNLTSKTTGSASNYSLSASSSTTDPNFSQPSFVPVPSGSTLTGGTDGSPGSGPLSLSTPTITAYTYDALDNLTNVLQGGSRPRTFVYNSVSQLTQATNPESGTINYTYDNDGNLLTKTDARGIQINYSPSDSPIDALHRVTKKTYSNGDPAVSYFYDQISYNGLTIGNGKGRRTGMSDAAGLAARSYDITPGVGWKTTEKRTIYGISKTTIQQNNLAGLLAQLTYPSGTVMDYGYDNAGRATSGVDAANNYAQNASYAAHGALANVLYGQAGGFAGITQTQTYNPRLQPSTIFASSINGTVLDFAYSFNYGTANNGNVASIANNRDTTRSLAFTYDELNRIKSAVANATSGPNCWGQLFGHMDGGNFVSGYDIWANLKEITPDPSRPTCGVNPLGLTFSTLNRIADLNYQYDAAGNLTYDPPNLATYQYDAENRMKSASGTLGSSSYTYDGDGKRVWKAPVGQPTQPTKLYWYGMGSDPLDETDGAGNTDNASFNEFIYFNGRRIARRDYLNNVNYYFADHLGTSRVQTTAAGLICYDADYYPFGGERVVTNACPQNYKFTGKERDTESGLDFFIARYYSSGLARFSSADPENAGADEGDPQSWNGYAYARNNPILYLDPLGLKFCKYTTDGKGNVTIGNCVSDDDFKKDPDKYKDYEYVLVPPKKEPDPLPPGFFAQVWDTFNLPARVLEDVVGKINLPRGSDNKWMRALDVVAMVSFPGGGAAKDALKGLSKKSIKHMSKHLAEFQALDRAFTVADQAALGKQIIETGTKIRPGLWEGAATIGGKTVTVRAGVGGAGQLKSVYIVK